MTTLVYFNNRQASGIAFATIHAVTNVDSEYHPVLMSTLPDPEDCIGKHVVIEHLVPTVPYLITMSRKALSVTLYPDSSSLSKHSFTLPANVIIHQDDQPAYLRLARMNNRVPDWLFNIGTVTSSSEIYPTMWSNANGQVGGSLREPLIELESILSDYYRGDGDLDMVLSVTNYADAVVSEQFTQRETLRVAGISGYALNVPHNLLRFALTSLDTGQVSGYANKDLVVVYTIRKGGVVGLAKVDTDVRSIIETELMQSYGVKAYPVGGSDNLLNFRCSLNNLYKLFSHGRQDVRTN